MLPRVPGHRLQFSEAFQMDVLHHVLVDFNHQPICTEAISANRSGTKTHLDKPKTESHSLKLTASKGP